MTNSDGTVDTCKIENNPLDSSLALTNADTTGIVDSTCITENNQTTYEFSLNLSNYPNLDFNAAINSVYFVGSDHTYTPFADGMFTNTFSFTTINPTPLYTWTDLRSDIVNRDAHKL